MYPFRNFTFPGKNDLVEVFITKEGLRNPFQLLWSAEGTNLKICT
jgi:hypothetical protein